MIVGFPDKVGRRGVRISRLKLETLDALMRVSLCSLPMENMDWARIFDTWELTKPVLPLKFGDD